MKNVGNNSRGRSQGVPKIFRAPMCRAHCAVIFAIAQLSCDTIPECDRQMDIRTDGHLCSGYTSACIARYANALVKVKEMNDSNNNNGLCRV